tara:strand:+ start:2066 stop:2605 length:540 start_codon:yes stop_codon:yes gene_type:complete
MSIFNDIRARKSGEEPFQWYRNRIRELGTPSQSELLRDGKLTGRVNFGRLNMYVYDPKYKDKLPYYDVFPLVLPIGGIPGGFLGINFHYLPYALRARLLDRLERDAKGPDDDMRIITSYNKLKNVNIVKPTLKKYLNSKVRSRFRRIDSEDFLTALMLPVQRFKKSSTSRVWSDSRKII